MKNSGKHTAKILARFGLSLMIMLLLAAQAFPQTGEAPPEARASAQPVTFEAYSSHAKIAPGGEIYVAVKLIVDPGWHVNSNAPNDEFLIPTEVALGEGAPVTLTRVVYPEAKSVKFEFSPEAPLSVFEDVAWIKVYLTANKDAKAGAATVPISVTAQACDNRSCVAPNTLTLAIPLEIDPTALTGEIRHRPLFESLGMIGAVVAPVVPATNGQSALSVPISSAPQENQGFWGMLKNFKADDFVGRNGYVLAFIAMYLLGMGLTLTPCVYPIIPITIGFFGSQASGKISRQFLMAAVFGLGIAISYAAVGTIAALSGTLMGAALQSKWVLLGLAALCVAMGFNAFGAFEIVMPAWFMGLAGSRGRRGGLAGSAIMGLTMGIAAAPCLAAFIVSLLAFVASKHDPLLGFSMFFTLGLGLATPFVALGTFSGLLSKAPKSGAWMVYAKKVMGALLFGAALYFLNPVLPKPIFHSLVMIALVAAGLYFGFFEPTIGRTWRFKAVRYFLGIMFLAVAVWWGMPAETALETGGIAWKPYSEEALTQARSEGKPVIIDVYADWCIPCKELDKLSFSDERVIEASRNVVMLKADITKGNSAEAKKVIASYGIKGVPTVIFIRPDGMEEADLRLNQFEKADGVLARFNALLSASGIQAAPIVTSTGD